ncbi:DUF4303 domain-containing protein [Tahibacter harae]|uniref:DUF4303 domain-containing protein n=1 Tax=Tahibacter harae TaxID=2963937 RepID=A0ABT1QU89_9GAMM|nr:DUF4303 domain-containing protein [Tahibacter harae]MCQ4165855.1 DUF4303 domain-containing protein [Tahibacter harae]
MNADTAGDSDSADASLDWTSFPGRIAAAARASFADLIERRKQEDFYAFALYTDADCYTVLPCANSIEKHSEKLSKAGVDDPAEMAGYQWYIGEWAYEAWKDEAFTAICRDLSAASQAACETGSFAAFRQQVHASMIAAMALLDGEGLFAPAGSETVIFISSTDQDEAFALENNSAEVLNSSTVYRKFLRRYAVGGT